MPIDGGSPWRTIIPQIIVDMLEAAKSPNPKTSAKRRHELLAIRKRLAT